MKKIFLMLLFVGIAAVTFSPQSSSAYVSTSQTAVRLNENTLLFTISYRLSFMNYELGMPIGAVRKAEHGEALPYVGYSLLTDDGTVFTEGETYSAVLSDAKIVGNEYFVPNSESGNFTLATLVKFPHGYLDSVKEDVSIHMRASTLPFTLVKEGKVLPSQLDSKQLTTYKTAVIEL